jgi:hypothetical protein
VRSAYPPERLEVELQSRLGPTLAQKGYRVVGHGVSGVTWRREMPGKVIVGLVVLGFLALGGFASGDPGSIAFGLLCAAGAGVLFYLRRPATVTISLARIEGGTELEVSSGPEAAQAEAIARTVVGPPPAAVPPGRPEAPGSLWGPPRA